jgi:DNA repair ATPase RecN
MEKVLNNFVVNEQVIESLRAHLNKIIADHGNDGLLHPDIIKFSQLLDSFISAYTATTMSNNQY